MAANERPERRARANGQRRNDSNGRDEDAQGSIPRKTVLHEVIGEVVERRHGLFAFVRIERNAHIVASFRRDADLNAVEGINAQTFGPENRRVVFEVGVSALQLELGNHETLEIIDEFLPVHGRCSLPVFKKAQGSYHGVLRQRQ